jgi:hypothetical protein
MTARTWSYTSPRSVRLAQARTSSKKRMYFLLCVTFNSAIAALAYKSGQLLTLTALDWLMLAFAVFRAARLISFDGVMSTYRSPFVKGVPHDSGMNDDVCARTDVAPWREAIGELLACPICTATWVAGILVGLWLFVPVYGRILAGVLSLAGAMEFLFAAFEHQQWQGELRRIECGRYKREV